MLLLFECITRSLSESLEGGRLVAIFNRNFTRIRIFFTCIVFQVCFNFTKVLAD